MSKSLITFGKPIEKFLELIGNAVGEVYKPTSIRKEADAKAYKILKLEKAKALAKADSSLIEAETLEKLEQRLIHKEISRQKNIDNIVKDAVNEISQDNSIPENNVNEDWLTRFFNISQDVSDSDMQKIWAKILAGEFKSPNSFSLKTLDFIKNLSKDEATLFIKAAKYSVFGFGIGNIMIVDLDQKINDSLKLQDILLLQELGVLNPTPLLFEILPETENIHLLYKNGGILFSNKQHQRVQVRYLGFTRIGTELLKLVDIDDEFDLGYLNHIAVMVMRMSNKIDVFYSEKVMVKDGLIIGSNPVYKLPRNTI